MNQQEIIYTLNSNQVLLIQMLCKGGSIDIDADKMSSLSYISWSSLYGVHSFTAGCWHNDGSESCGQTQVDQEAGDPNAEDSAVEEIRGPQEQHQLVDDGQHGGAGHLLVAQRTVQRPDAVSRSGSRVGRLLILIRHPPGPL